MNAPVARAAWALAAWVWLAMPTATAQTIDLSKITPRCSALLFKETPGPDGKCQVDADAVGKLDEAGCKAVPGLNWGGTPAKCTGTPAKPPTPTCSGDISGILPTPKDGKCHLDRSVPRSAVGDFLGDCFRIDAQPSPETPPLIGGHYLKVLSSRLGANGTDTLLTVARADGRIPVFSCNAQDKAVPYEINASELARIGAKRYGWAYGVLAMPYKFYEKSKKIGDGAAIGPYLGWRMGEPGSGTTFAMSLALSKVKGEVRDAQSNVTSTPDLAAISAAAGVMWDVRKATGIGKPFTVGLFVGTDRVSSDNVVKFPHNGKGWLALQIGYDFTDN
jgi:hypothetical protein